MTVTLDPVQHAYYVDGIRFNGPSVTQALAKCGLADFSFVQDELRERSMRRGTSVHWMLALHDQGALDYRKVPHTLRPYRKAWMLFRDSTGFTPFGWWIEKSFISSLGYSGTIDRVGDFPWLETSRTSPATIDIKTGDGPIDNWVRYQLSLYCDESKTARRIAVKLRSNGTYIVKEYPFNSFYTDRAVAMEAVKRWKKTA